MKSKKILLFLLVMLVILSVIAHKVTNKKNKLLSFWLGFSVINIFFSYMIIHKDYVVNYSCKNDYWNRTDYNLDGHFLLESYGEYKCGCDLRYNYSNSIVYYNELINILLSFVLLFTVGNTIIFKDVLFLQALNTIIYFATLKDYSNMDLRKTIYLGFSSLNTIIPLILIYQLK
jgi:hypothetical protein